MEDRCIVELYWQRDESAIAETETKYGKYLHRIAYRILQDAGDAEECVNDTCYAAWNAMPPHCPSVLSAFLGKITRRISIDLLRKKNAEKRGSGEYALALEELEECISGSDNVEEIAEREELKNRINSFLRSLPAAERNVFMCRYWYMESVSEIAKRSGFSESKVKSMLYRTRNKLRTMLEKEGW